MARKIGDIIGGGDVDGVEFLKFRSENGGEYRIYTSGDDEYIRRQLMRIYVKEKLRGGAE